MPPVDDRDVLRTALDFTVSGAEDRLAVADYDMASILVAIGRSYLDHPMALLLADDLPWRRLLRRLDRACRLAGPAPVAAGEWIEDRIGRYLTEARERLAPSAAPPHRTKPNHAPARQELTQP